MSNLSSSPLLQYLACPLDHSSLREQNSVLACEDGHSFAVENGIPVLTGNPRREPVPGNMAPCRPPDRPSTVDWFVNDWIVNTNGNLYWPARGKLVRYPIPRWPFEEGRGKRLLDIGCGWGRWSIAAARSGYKPFGLDVHLDALAAMRRVSRQLEVETETVCAEADHLPFLSASIDAVFSYSVLQHLEKSKAINVFKEIARILKPDGLCMVQLPCAFGLYNMLLQAKRGFREARQGTFEMRYWTRSAISRGLLEAGLQLRSVRADGFFSQNPQLSDLDLLSPSGKLVVRTSSAGRTLANALPVLTFVADSLWIEARKTANV